MKQTIKTFWAHRKQNGFVLIEIALVALLTFFVLDNLVVSVYDTYCCTPDGEFEKEHLLVAQLGESIQDAPATESEDADTARLKPFERNALRKLANFYTIRDLVRSMSEVQYAGLANNFVGRENGYYTAIFSAEADSTRRCKAYEGWYVLHEQFFETQGLTPVEGSPSAAVLSDECPIDGVVISRSMAIALFGTDQVVGRRIVDWDTDNLSIQENGGSKVRNRYTVAGVVKDFRMRPHDRYAYSVLATRNSLGISSPMMLIRLRPEVDAEAFMEKIVSEELKAGSAKLVQVNKFTASSRLNTKEFSIINSVLGVFIGLLLLNVMLGTLGTYWLQIRKRTEDIGIMRSFGAKRRHIFGMIWKEAALLTLIASVIGQMVWLQFALNSGLEHGYTMSGTGKETDWVNTFWQHYLVICVIQYLILLAIVTLGMVVPTFIAMYKRPVEALRHE